MEISLLKPEVCEQVARLHIQHLRTPFSGRAGQKLLALYYQAVCMGKGATGYIAQSDGEILGYVCGIWDFRHFRSTLLRTHWFGLSLWGIIQTLSKPSLLNDLIKRLYSSEQSDSYTESKSDAKIYELRPIVVSPNARGSGVAPQLVEHLIRDARVHGFHSIFLFVEQDNVAAQRFYKRVGFYEVGRAVLRNRAHLYYEMPIL